MASSQFMDTFSEHVYILAEEDLGQISLTMKHRIFPTAFAVSRIVSQRDSDLISA